MPATDDDASGGSEVGTGQGGGIDVPVNTDVDGEGVSAAADCDDNDATLGAIAADADGMTLGTTLQPGTVTAGIDCNDIDPNSETTLTVVTCSNG